MIKGRSRPNRVRLFKSDRLECLSTMSPRSFALTWAPALMLVLYAGWGTTSALASVTLVALGVVLWTVFEYCMHRFFFHLEMRSAVGRRLIFLMHGNHHAAPGDSDRNLMPPLVSIAILGTVWCGFLALVGSPGSTLFLGFAIGYVAYDLVHYACHQFPMRGPILRQLQRHHIRHHYAKQDGNFAITAIFWDRVFGTGIMLRER